MTRSQETEGRSQGYFRFRLRGVPMKFRNTVKRRYEESIREKDLASRICAPIERTKGSYQKEGSTKYYFSVDKMCITNVRRMGRRQQLRL